ncbi:MAG: aminotransferase class I/II-fold pyridoxal phosphate-dependent enzyme, partial [Actinomycetes bacterium]
FFDLYAAAIALAGGVQVTVPLVVPSLEFASEPAFASAPGTGQRAPGTPAPGFRLDADALAAAITDRTRLILVNSPHNPTGMVLDLAELQQIADLAIAHDLIVLSDEAYEHLYFAPSDHVPIATLPGMFERTVSVGSGGKSFSFTGWKVGWASGPTHLIAAVRVVRQHLSYVSGGPFQSAIAAGLRLPDAYFEQFRIELMAKRDHLSAGLTSLGFGVISSQGTYFLITDVRPLGYVSGTDFCRELPARAGVVAIPVAALAQRHEQFDSFVRWTFCKRREVLDAALDRLAVGAE